MSGPKHLTVAPRTVLDLDHVLVTIVQCCPSSGDVMAFLAALPASAHTTPLAALHELLRNPVEAIQFMVDWRRSSPAVNPLEHETAVRMLWPVLQLHELTAAAAALAVHAMPAFTVVAARAVDPKQRVLGPEDFHWLGQWATKIVHYKVRWFLNRDQDRDGADADEAEDEQDLYGSDVDEVSDDTDYDLDDVLDDAHPHQDQDPGRVVADRVQFIPRVCDLLRACTNLKSFDMYNVDNATVLLERS